MRRLTPLLLLCAALLALACGGGRDKEGATVRPTPDDGGIEAMAPGQYRTSVFEPEMTFEITEPFWEKEIETKDKIGLWGVAEADAEWGEGSVIDVFRPYAIYDPTKPRRGREWPSDMVAFLREHPDLETTAPRKAEVGGLPAQVLDLRPRKDVELWLDSAEQQHLMDTDRRIRVYVVDAGEEERVIVMSVPRKKGFEPLERVVRTMRFAGG